MLTVALFETLFNMVNTLTKRTPRSFIGANVHQKLPSFSWPTLTTQLHTTNHNYATACITYVAQKLMPLFYSLPVPRVGMWDFRWNKSDGSRIYVRNCKDFWRYHCSIASTWCQSTMCSDQTSLLPEESVRNIHKQHCIVYGRARSTQASLVTGRKMRRLPKQEKEVATLAYLSPSCYIYQSWNSAVFLCHRLRDSTHHNPTTGTRYLNPLSTC